MAKLDRKNNEPFNKAQNGKKQENKTNEQDADVNVTEKELAPDNLADDEMEAMQKEIAEIKDAHLRLIADFDNYRKRTLKEKAELIKSGGEKVFVELLPIMDDFERAIKSINDSGQEAGALKEGVDLIYNKFISFLNKNGVQEIKTKDAVFDTDLFEAVAIIPAPTPELKGKVIECVEKGYTLHDKVIRHAKVVVGE
ncbi:MAG: nucleotide exchange factor GrpE [Bacteroidales bacterium]|nr:nucleotide exchange factor GrpE [Bacteroidales bacterium]